MIGLNEIFLRKILVLLELYILFINLIMMCVSSASYAFLLNGVQVLFGRPRPECGLRQRDLLSPYWFILVVEAFIALNTPGEQVGHIHGVRIPLTTPSISHLYFAPSISHLCFANDTLVFSQAMDALALKRIFDTYAAVLGQVVNF